MVTKTFPAKVEELDNVLDFINAGLEEAECGMKDQMQIAVAVEELFVNVAHYAYGKDSGEGDCEVVLNMDNEGYFSISFRDLGTPFDPLAKEDPDVTLSAEDREIGGLGIYMVKKFMDKVTYERDGQYNVMTIAKKIK